MAGMTSRAGDPTFGCEAGAGRKAKEDMASTEVAVTAQEAEPVEGD